MNMNSYSCYESENSNLRRCWMDRCHRGIAGRRPAPLTFKRMERNTHSVPGEFHLDGIAGSPASFYASDQPRASTRGGGLAVAPHAAARSLLQCIFFGGVS